MSSNERRDNPLAQLVLGLTILTAGVLFWLDRINALNASDYLRWWPLALIAMGIAHLQARRVAAASAWLIAGAFFLLPLLGLRAIHFWHVIGMWPLLISAAGVTLVVQSLRATPDRSFSAIAVMAGNHRKVGSQEFTGGSAIAMMGGCQIDLSSARISGEAIVDVLAFWGGIEIVVPDGWRVDGKVIALLGGYVDKTTLAPETAPRLVIRGTAVMGGIEVRNSVERSS